MNPFFALIVDTTHNVQNAVGGAVNAAGDFIEKTPLPGAAQAIGNAAGAVGNTIGNAANAAGETLGNAANAAGETLGNVGNAVGNTLGNVAGAVGNTLGTAAGAVGNAVGTAATTVAHGAQSLAAGAVDTIGKGIEELKKHTPDAQIKAAKKTAFKDGMRKAAELCAQKSHAYTFALVALTCYSANCDGCMSDEEREELRGMLHYIESNEEIPGEIKRNLEALATADNLAFSDLTRYLDAVSVPTLRNIECDVETIVNADDIITPSEIRTMEELRAYIVAREETGA